MLQKSLLEVGGLYQVKYGHLVNLYASSDFTREFYENFHITSEDHFIVIDNFVSGIMDGSTALVLTTKGLGRIPLGDKSYNEWRYYKVETDT